MPAKRRIVLMLMSGVCGDYQSGRLAADLTQEALAERAGLSVYGIQKLELGTTHPYGDTTERPVTALQLAGLDAQQLRATVKPVRRHASRPRDVATREFPHNLPLRANTR